MSGRRYPIPGDTSSRMRIIFQRAVWTSIDIGKIIRDEIDNEIIENLRSLQEADKNAENDE
jgi:hypothetical protein